ncbi:DUF6122 family protein [Porifericola rhodea]|uniref:DUF6122 family protein n=1 Tax=Porifericola rhodea TaxID=930972 RepID=UPI00266546CE|nr:DUF6122 family protein [Porifericola rhodea]WKN30189.1 DUF6122 family protein [Porifericola rhodea]
MQTFVHYFLHLVFPAFLACMLFKKQWKKAYLILLATMLVDLDHLLANPVFQDNRCSIGFHYLHTVYAMVVYVVLLFLRRPFNIIGLGLLFHMFTDLIDCLFMFSECKDCYRDAPAYEVLKVIADTIGI